MTTQEIMERTKLASRGLCTAATEQKNLALREMADAVTAASDKILAANSADMEAARGKITEVMLDRLLLTPDRIEAMANGILKVTELPDPTGQVLETITHPDGLTINKISVPMGVIAIIYESRPNVTSDAAALAIKSGSACILRCGKEAHASAKAITLALQDGLERAGLSRDLVMLIDDTSRDSARELMCGKGYIDLLIPRGGSGLIRACVENATVPCIETGTGICHIYVDKDADTDKALKIVTNAKVSRPSVCNAAEVCIVHKDIAQKFLPMLEKALTDDRKNSGLPPVELRADKEAQAFLKHAKAAEEKDFNTEFLDYILAVKTVSSLEDAVCHILSHSTGHSDAIVTQNKSAADFFTANTDSAAVYVNASTRFTDGGEFGLGCEMGISTQKLHARGPMGLRELTTYKYVIVGDGNIR
ncbi:MAG: glutamate-5-semialdehyde dehydrogenase [Clostridia bacterium]|nr:glutamate-5-semialdehyde dehydrogenase [Clostridia bacterium]